MLVGAAFDYIFSQEILQGVFISGDINVYGVAPNGSASKFRALNTDKLDALEKFVRDKMEQGVDKEATWKKCVKALNRKIWKLNPKNKNKTVPNELDDGED